MMTVFLSKYSSRRFTRERENQCFHDDEGFFMKRIDCNGWAQTNPQGGGLQKKNIIFIHNFEHLLNSFVKSVDERGVCEKNRI